VGNALDLYDRIEWWDDINHLGNWMLLSAAFVSLGGPHDATRLTRVALGVGFGAVVAIVWEALECVTFIPDSPEAATAYQDTLGDLTLGLLGSLTVPRSLPGTSIGIVGIASRQTAPRPQRRFRLPRWRAAVSVPMRSLMRASQPCSEGS
jgi:hypothetical protein